MSRFLVSLLVCAAAATPSVAAISIVGAGLGRECFLAAELKRDTRTSLSICERALDDNALNRRDRAATLVNRGIVHMYDRNLTMALRDYKQAVELEPNMAEAHVNLGIALLRKGGADREAIAALTKGISMHPAKPEVAYYTRAVAYEMVGNVKGAYEDYVAAAAAKPDWTEPAEQLKRFQVERRPSQQG